MTATTRNGPRTAWIVALALMVTVFKLLVVLEFAREYAALGQHARSQSTHATLACYQTALSMYYVDCGKFPSEAEGLQALQSVPAVPNWNGPYLRGMPLDAWGRPLRYRLPDGKPTVESAGADGRFDTGDDVVERAAEATASALNL